MIRPLAIVLALAFASCSPVVRQTRETAQKMEARGDLVDAEKWYAQKMGGTVTAREYSQLRDLRCDLRMKIARDELERLENSGTFEDVTRLHEYVRRCANFEDVDVEIANFGISLVERVFVEQVEPLWAAGKPYEALDIAVEGSRHLPKDHPRQEWIREHRRLLAAPYAAGAQKYAAYPVTAAVFGVLHNNTGATPAIGAYLAGEVNKQLAVSRANAFTGQALGECAGYMSQIPTVAAATNGPKNYVIDAASASNCRTNVVIADGVETYEVPVQKQQTVTKRVAVTRPVESKHTTVTRSCRPSSFGTICDNVGSETKTYRYNETSYKDVQVTEVVTVMETRTRPVRTATATMTANVAVRVSGFGQQQAQSTEVSVTSGQQNFPLGTPDATVRQYMTNMRLADRLADEAYRAVGSLADQAGRGARTKDIAARAGQAYASGDLDTARELGLIVWAESGQLLPNEELYSIFGPSLAKQKPDTLPTVADATWMQDRVEANVFKQDPLDSFFEGILVRGYPWNVSSMGGGYRTPESGLAAQPDRAAIDLMLDTEMRWSVMTGKFHRGVGLLLGADLGLSIGNRLGDDYERLVPLPLYVSEEDAKELKVTLGMRASVQAMLGFRVFFVGLFAGFRPSYTNFSIGHFFSEGGTLPVAGRLELRLQERFPIIIEGWYGHFGKGDKEHMGGTVLIPLKTSTGGTGGFWIRGRFDQFTLPATIPGLFEKDDVLVPGVTTTSGMLAFGYAF